MPTNERARFGLDHPIDLLEKLRFDLSRLEAAENESRGREVIFAAMDCAVAIVAIKDWTARYCKHRELPEIDFHSLVPNFSIANEMANGLKHFVVDNKFAKTSGFASGSIMLQSVNGVPVKAPHVVWVGFEDETVLARSLFQTIAIKLEKILAGLPD